MIMLRTSASRGHLDHGWLNSRHSFSFGSYQDPQHDRFGNLRVINEDRIAPGTGFATHGHRDMEIISVVLSGALSHRDSLGHGSVILPGDVQRMSAGTGIRHSEHNHAVDQETHFLQIWLDPVQPGGEPDYAQQRFDPEGRQGRLQIVISPDGREGSMSSRADALMSVGRFDDGQRWDMSLDAQRLCYVHLVSGELTVNGHALTAGDAMGLQSEERLSLSDGRAAEVLVFDLVAMPRR